MHCLTKSWTFFNSCCKQSMKRNAREPNGAIIQFGKGWRHPIQSEWRSVNPDGSTHSNGSVWMLCQWVKHGKPEAGRERGTPSAKRRPRGDTRIEVRVSPKCSHIWILKNAPLRKPASKKGHIFFPFLRGASLIMETAGPEDTWKELSWNNNKGPRKRLKGRSVGSEVKVQVLSITL